MKQYADRERGEVEEYKVGDLVLLSTKDLKYQMAGRCTEKFTEHFVGPYKVKAIVSSSAIELELPSTKEMPQPVVIEGEEEWEVEKMMNKRKVQGRDKYLV